MCAFFHMDDEHKEERERKQSRREKKKVLCHLDYNVYSYVAR